MSEYWVSKKKYYCKYCEIYIADDAPSKQQHENGLRHKGNVERYIRGIYKAGEKKKKDQEEEKREMARVEQAARAAFAQDVSSGHAKASSAPIASTSSGPRKPATKPSNPYANYSTAEQLGFTDPDAEKLEIRKSQGVVGEWQIVESAPAPPPIEAEGDLKPEILAGVEAAATATENSAKRPAEAPPEEDTRIFKLHKKTAAVGLGEIYDPGLIPIKPKKKKEEIPPNPPPPPAAPRWVKVQWGQPIQEEEAAAVSPEQPFENISSGSTLTEPVVKPEEDVALTMKAESSDSNFPCEPGPQTTGLFKKRKAPAGVGRGRKQI